MAETNGAFRVFIEGAPIPLSLHSSVLLPGQQAGLAFA